MKKFDRQPDQKPAEPFAGGHDPNRPEPERKAPNLPEKDKSKAPHRPEDAGNPVDKTREPAPRFGGKESLEGERSDRASSGRPLQLEDEEEPGRTEAEPGFGDRQRDARQDRKSPEGQPIKR
jgi:hypothetical protein